MLQVLTEKEVEDTLDNSPDKLGSATEVRRMRDWLNRKIEQGKKADFSETVTITPVLASLLLQNNPVNRNVLRHNLDALKRDIIENRWQVNGEAVVVSREGNLIDGQHRCQAVVQTRQSIRSVIAFGIDESARFTIDIGRPKSAANFLHMLGYTNTNNLAAVVSMLLCYERNGDVSKGFNRPTKPEIIAYAENAKGLQESLDYCWRAAKPIGAYSALTFVHYLIKKKISKTVADEFALSVMDGEGLRKGDPVFLLRNRLMEMRGKGAEEKARIIARAYNHWRLGEKISKLVLPTSFPKLEK